MLFVLIFGRIEARVLPIKETEHLTLKLNKIPAELCIHLLPMHDELLALYFSFCLRVDVVLCWVLSVGLSACEVLSL